MRNFKLQMEEFELQMRNSKLQMEEFELHIKYFEFYNMLSITYIIFEPQPGNRNTYFTLLEFERELSWE